MLTVHEDERQKQVALRAGYHGFVAVFIAALVAAGVGLFVLRNDALAFGAMSVLVVAMVTYHVSLWRGGWFEYVREMANRTGTDRVRARRQAIRWVAGMSTWLFIYGIAFSGRPLDRALMGATAGSLAIGALVWWFYLRRPGPEE
jgi:hypothetical protein